MMEWCTSSFCSPRNFAETALSVYECRLYSLRTAWRTSKMTRPSIVISLVSRVPIWAEDIFCFLMRVRFAAIRPNRENASHLSVLARSTRYGMSKPTMLYPVMMSGSLAMTKSRHACSIAFSSSNECTSAPEIGAQVLRVKMFLTMGFFEPWTETQLAIWMTGSFSGSGKCPLRPAHSISKERVRSGAILPHSPSGACESTMFHHTSTSIWQVDALLTRGR
mmetsp:Transcript_34757/g.82380  ORF Transcript_34757/g.82380 Transcript_34757/m.82380 type:complete len:221 (+) Transcript_34757:2231-2893(+)